MATMNKAWLLTGSNLGDRVKNLSDARELVAKNGGPISRLSHIYETAPWGNINQPPFLNQALEIETSLNPQQLMREILKIEKSMGRKRGKKYDPRLIDIDILLFNNDQIDSKLVRVPHPEMARRRFVLVPLAEIAPQIVHPGLGKNIKLLLSECQDELEVKKINPDNNLSS